MKTIKSSVAIGLLLLAAIFTSCSSDDTTTTNNNNEPGELALFVIDTARVNSISITGTNATTIIDRMENLNSYISDLSISPDGTMIAYTNYQSVFSPDAAYKREVRVANIDGTNDHIVFSSNASEVSIGAIRFGSDNKVFYVTQTYSPTNTRTMNLVNADGTGHEVITGSYNITDISDYNITDISDDREYYLIPTGADNGNPTRMDIIDRDADNGAGGLYHSEPFPTGQIARGGKFTNDGKLVVIPFTESGEMKARIIDVATKTATTKTLVPGLGSGWLSFHLEMAADSNRGVITLTGADYPKSKTYIFNLETGEVSAPFENSDENIFDVYIH
ncbi:MAG: hypothetical protein EOO45_20900 [Flavobacterium sp.]|nr:MAG: hypothetical protein EOO45_20900 [Flavobacterium sp.]